MIPAIQPTPIPTNEATQRSENADRDRFRSALEQRSLDVLGRIMDPSSTASLPGAGTALVGAATADSGDAASIAAAELASGEATQSFRERGLDAASRSAGELNQRAQATADSAEQEPFAPNTRERSSVRERTGGEKTVSQSDTADSGTSKGSGRTSAPGEPLPAAGNRPETTGARQPDAATAAAVAGPRAIPGITGSSVAGASSAGTVAAVGASGGAGSATSGTSSPLLALSRESALRSEGLSQRVATPKPAAQDPQEATAQVQRGLAQVLRQRGGSMTLKLTPNELGEVRVSLMLADRRVTGTIEAKTESARDLLLQNLDSLRSSLERRGVTVDRLDVRLQEGAESTTRASGWQDAGPGSGRTGTHAGGDGAEAHTGGERRGGADGEPGGGTGERALTHDDGSSASAAGEDAGQGSPAERAGVWLRLDAIG